MNPLGNGQPTPISPALQGLAETLRFARSFSSPQAFMQELHKNNPQLAQQLVHLSQTVKNPMLAAQQVLAQQGISPEQIQSLLNQK